MPKVVQVLLFLTLAVVSALAGTLDDWVRITLGFLFFGVAISLMAEIQQSHRQHEAAIQESYRQHEAASTPLPPPPPTIQDGL